MTCAMVKSRYIGDGHPTFNRNPYNGYINPYYWVELPIPYYMEISWELIDPIAHMIHRGTSKPSFGGDGIPHEKTHGHLGPLGSYRWSYNCYKMELQPPTYNKGDGKKNPAIIWETLKLFKNRKTPHRFMEIHEFR